MLDYAERKIFPVMPERHIININTEFVSRYVLKIFHQNDMDSLRKE